MSHRNNDLRLGSIRRNRRDYSVHQRPTGKTTADRLYENQLYEITQILIMSFLLEIEGDDGDEDDSLDFDMLLLCIGELIRLNQPCLLTPRPISRLRVSFDSFYEEEYEMHFGFGKNQCQQLFELLELPSHITIGQDRHHFRVDSVHCFLYLLNRLHSPSQRQTLDQQMFCYDYSTLSKIFNATINYIDDTYASHLRNLSKIVDKFPMFNERIVAKMMTLYPDENIPNDCIHCALFADGVRFRVSRPDGEFWVQKAVFSGDKWFHNHGSLAVTGPDGIIYDWYDLPLGRYNDKHFMSESGINDIMEDIQADNIIYWIYTDKGFDKNTCIRSAAHGPGYVSPAAKIDNHKMSRERITEEWCFAKVKQLFPFISRPNLLKLQLVDVSAYVRVAVFLTNCHTCLNQSETGL